MSRDEYDRRMPALGKEPLSEFYTRHFAEPNIEHVATELGMLRIRQEGLRRVISDRLKSGRA